mmetsp:Transcript_12794/g.38580  ORF Transcript_12794/g.38580 Transcript_12794/m.38580 type:complete len:100 (+) Transcript_12794:1510-1809(+)
MAQPDSSHELFQDMSQPAASALQHPLSQNSGICQIAGLVRAAAFLLNRAPIAAATVQISATEHCLLGVRGTAVSATVASPVQCCTQCSPYAFVMSGNSS